MKYMYPKKFEMPQARGSGHMVSTLLESLALVLGILAWNQLDHAGYF
jgi:hypothetical protein